MRRSSLDILSWVFLSAVLSSFALTPVSLASGFAPDADAQPETQRFAPDTTAMDYEDGEFILKLGVSGEHTLDSLLRAHNLELVRSLLLPGYHLIRAAEGFSSETLRELLGESLVEFVEPNYVRRLDFLPDDPFYSYQWHLHQIQSESAWDRVDGTGVLVAVLDTGVAYENYDVYAQTPDLSGTVFAQGYDFYNIDSHPNDDDGHGTHVTGTIAQTTNNGLGVAGLAFGSSIMPVKVCGGVGEGCPLSSIIDGIVYATDNGARVISMSLGSPSYSQGELDAVNYAYQQGVVVVASAGNDDTDARHYPAAFNQVIATGATDYRQDKAYYSNYGDWIDFVAPGGDVRYDRNSDGYVDGVLQQTLDDAASGDFSSFSYWFYQGTSMATPHVSALAALLLSVNPQLTPAEVYSFIRDSALDLGTSGKDYTFGWGLIQASDAIDLALAPAQTADLTFGDVWIDPSNPAEGDSVNLFAIMRNIGSGPAESFTVAAYVDGDLYATGEFTLAALTEMTVFATWTAAPGTHRIDWIIDLNDVVSELNEDNNVASLFVDVAAQGRVIIAESYVSDPRVSVGTTQTVGFRAVWDDGVSPVSDGIIFVNGDPFTPDQDGWVWLQATSDDVSRGKWSVTGVMVDGITDFQQIAPDAEVVWDRIKVVAVWVSDSRADVGSTQEVYVNAVYEYDGLQLTQGIVFLDGEPMSWDPETSRWTGDVTNLGVGETAHEVTGVIDFLHDLTEYTSKGEVEIVWDRLEVYASGSDDGRVDVGTFTAVWFNVRWAYDGMEFGAGQELFVNGAPASWSGERERWEITTSQPSVISIPFAVTGHTDSAFDIIARTDLVGPTAVVWDMIECYYLALDDERVDVGTTIEFRVRCLLSYDSHELGPNDSVSADFGVLLWDEENSWFENGRTQSTVGDYVFIVVSGHEATYDISRLRSIPPDPIGIWDQIEVHYEALDDDRVNVNTDIVFKVRARLEYDGHQLVGGDSVTANFGPLAWDGNELWFYGLRRQDAVGSHPFGVTSATEITHMITTVRVAIPEPTGVWDRVDCYYEALHDSRVNANSAIELRIRCMLEYDGHELGFGDMVTASFGPLAWDPADAWFVGQRTQDTVGSFIFGVYSVSETTYEITAFVESASNPTGIYDLIRIRALGAERTRIDVNTENKVFLIGELEFDGHPLGLGDVVVCNGMPMPWNVVEASFVGEESESSVGAKTYDYCEITETTYGITAADMNGQKVTVVWDRMRVVDGGLLDPRMDVGSGTTVWFRVYYEYDGLPLAAASSVLVNGAPAMWNPGADRWEIPSGISEEMGSSQFGVTSVTDSAYRLTALLDDAGAQTVIWDRVLVQLQAADSRLPLGGRAQIETEAVYEYDMSPFDGEIHLGTELTQYSVGSFIYAVTSVSGGIHGISVFQANSVDVVFDVIHSTAKVETLIPGRLEILMTLHYESDGTPVTGATTTVGGSLASEIEPGKYSLVVQTLMPVSEIQIATETAGFPKIVTRLTAYSVGNLGLYSGGAGVATLLLLLRRHRKKRKTEELTL